jgi:rhamnogalacturonan acetylesterase
MFGVISMVLASLATCHRLSAAGADVLPAKPTLFIIGDSTVKNGTQGQMGWGTPIAGLFDSSRITVANHAIGGRSSRTFLTEGRWDKVLADLKAGDFVSIQFGHNDSGPLDDKARARGTLRGTGDESREIDNPITQKREVVHTYGWYLRKYVAEAKAKGATPIVCSPVPRNIWKEGKVARASNDYGKWAKEVAAAEGASFLDLNELIAVRYEALGEAKVKTLFGGDHTHTNEEGARLNASIIAEGLRGLAGTKVAGFLRSQSNP